MNNVEVGIVLIFFGHVHFASLQYGLCSEAWSMKHEADGADDTKTSLTNLNSFQESVPAQTTNRSKVLKLIKKICIWYISTIVYV